MKTEIVELKVLIEVTSKEGLPHDKLVESAKKCIHDTKHASYGSGGYSCCISEIWEE